MPKRKRSRTSTGVEGGSDKRLKTSDDMELAKSQTTHAVLSQYYGEVTTLRKYLLAQLPLASRKRRRRLLSLQSTSQTIDKSIVDLESLVNLLDSTLIGVPRGVRPGSSDRWKQWQDFSQLADISESTLRFGKASDGSNISEVGKPPLILFCQH
jgi:hypothetical protein